MLSGSFCYIWSKTCQWFSLTTTIIFNNFFCIHPCPWVILIWIDIWYFNCCLAHLAMQLPGCLLSSQVHHFTIRTTNSQYWCVNRIQSLASSGNSHAVQNRLNKKSGVKKQVCWDWDSPHFIHQAVHLTHQPLVLLLKLDKTQNFKTYLSLILI